MAQTDFTANITDLSGSGDYSIVLGGARLEYAENQIVDKIRDLLAQSANQTTY